MTRTERMQLYHWSPEDFVDLDQVNANFDALEKTGGDYNDAAATLRRALAHQAQFHLHTGGQIPLRMQNLLNADFSRRSGQVAAVYQLQNVYGQPMLIPNIQPEVSVATNSLSITNAASGILCELKPTGYGTLSSLKLPAPTEEMEDVTVAVLEGDSVLYESDPLDFAAGTSKTVSVSCEIAPGHTYRIRLRRTTVNGYNVWQIPAGSCVCKASGTVYSEGYFTTNAFPFGAGSVFDLWVYYTGAAPALARSVDGGIWHPMTAEATATGVTLDGESCNVQRFRLTDIAGHSMRLKFTLSSTSTLVRDCCGCLL